MAACRKFLVLIGLACEVGVILLLLLTIIHTHTHWCDTTTAAAECQLLHRHKRAGLDAVCATCLWLSTCPAAAAVGRCAAVAQARCGDVLAQPNHYLQGCYVRVGGWVHGLCGLIANEVPSADAVWAGHLMCPTQDVCSSPVLADLLCW